MQMMKERRVLRNPVKTVTMPPKQVKRLLEVSLVRTSLSMMRRKRRRRMNRKERQRVKVRQKAWQMQMMEMGRVTLPWHHQIAHLLCASH
jgi:hypothetical protein